MAIPDRDTNYNADGSRRDLYQVDGNTSAAWVIGAIIVVALVIIGYFVFAGRSTAPSGVNVNATTPQTTTSAPAVPGPADNTASPNTNATPMTTTPSPAPAAPADTSTTPGASSAPATPATPAPAAPATAPAAPATGQ
jgi:hypothetical protein